MVPGPDAHILRISRLQVSVAAVTTLVIGLLVLAGWLLPLPILRSGLPGIPETKPNTALALILSATALWASRSEQAGFESFLRAVGLACGITVALLGVLTLAQDLFSWNIGIDVLIQSDIARSVDLQLPGRMSQASAVDFIILGAALTLLYLRPRAANWTIQLLAALTFFSSLMALIGYAYDVRQLYRPMALPTAIATLALSLGVLAARPERAFMKVITAQAPGGTMLRRLLPLVILLPIVLGWVRLAGQRAGFYGFEFGLALLVIFNTLILTTVLWWTARPINLYHAELQQTEERYRSTLENMMEGCQIIGFNWRYLYLNDVAVRHGHGDKTRMLGRTMMEVYPGIDATPMFTELRRCMEKRVHHRMENEFAYSDGSKGWFSLSIEPVPEGIFILSTDITKEKELQEELRKHREHLEELVEERTAQLEAANKELEAFSYSVSHDLRAPLRHIVGFSEMLQKHASDSLDERGRHHLNTIADSAKEMGVLIDELLVFSRMGRTEMRTAVVDVGYLVKEIIERESTRPEVRQRTIDWTIDPLPHVRADPTMLRLVFQNLIGNAIKFTRRRDKAVVHIGTSSETTRTVFFVRDNGAGFDMQYAQKLFGVFQRLHRTEDFEGTGVGLANVRRIVSRHGGKTWAEGEVDKGATFYFSLPKLTEGRT